MLLLLKAFLLGIVEGLTEFLPISSTGHLIVVGKFLRYPQGQEVTFEIFIQLGSILAVLWFYRRDLLALAARVPSDPAARDLFLKVGLAFLPAAVAGLLCHGFIEEHLFSVATVAATLVAGGLVILAVERGPDRGGIDRIERISWRQALWIGLAQTLSLIPGVSRAGATIIGGMLAGLSRPVATQFSFYLAIPTLGAASLYALAKGLRSLAPDDAAPLAVGFAAAFVSALLVIRFFIGFVRSHDFRPFGYYRIALGAVLALLALLG